MIKKGEKAPYFTLKDSDMSDVSLQDFKGRPVVVFFFPLAFSGVCTKEICLIRDDFSSFNKLNAQVLGISVDSLFTLKKFKQELGLSFPLLSDWNKEVSRAYQALYEDFYGMRGVAKRSAFVIDGEGIVKYAEVLDNAENLPDFDKIKETLSVLD